MGSLLPGLAFNGRLTSEGLRFEEFRLARERANGATMNIEPLIPREDFIATQADLVINGLKINAYANPPVRAERIRDGGASLWVLRSGAAESYTATSKFQSVPKITAFLSASDTSYFTTSYRNTVRISLDEGRLNRTFSAMLGMEKTEVALANSRFVPLIHHDISYYNVFENNIGQIDSVNADESALEVLRLDDAILRWCAAVLNPDLFFAANQNSVRFRQRRSKVAFLCEYLMANLTQKISLSDMEQMSGLSARVLQYSFQREFGLRPKEWLRKQRLQAARAMLRDTNGAVKLSSIAYDFCFASASDFARQYHHEFGELPSETVRKKRR